MAQCETVDRILHAATILFAERGFAETSLRTITGMADVNLAAVNYHFGTKKALIQAVFSRFLVPFSRELERRLTTMEAELQPGQNPKADKLLAILLESLQSSMKGLNETPHRFMKLLGLAYTQSQEHLRHHLAINFGSTYERYTGWLKRALPHLEPVPFYWRLNFMLGAAIFTLSSFDSIQSILRAEHHVDMEIDDAMNLMVPALAGMLASDSGQIPCSDM